MSGFDVSAFTDEDGIVHVTVTQEGRAWEVQGQPVVTIEDRIAPLDGSLGAPLLALTPAQFRLEISPAQVTVRTVPVRQEVEE